MNSFYEQSAYPGTAMPLCIALSGTSLASVDGRTKALKQLINTDSREI